MTTEDEPTSVTMTPEQLADAIIENRIPALPVVLAPPGPAVEALVARVRELEVERDILMESNPFDIRACGWAVAVHNDYRLNGAPHTFWLFTQSGRAVKGEGPTDADALNRVREQIGLR